MSEGISAEEWIAFCEKENASISVKIYPGGQMNVRIERAKGEQIRVSGGNAEALQGLYSR